VRISGTVPSPAAPAGLSAGLEPPNPLDDAGIGKLALFCSNVPKPRRAITGLSTVVACDGLDVLLVRSG